ncbi:sodium/glutamate symporter [Salimicrobium halophilum]|uniref:Glutamate:Na+ symporter, ESS family n=1 Tax=Salimicrobium halophilum TaxID=86666 RepID=A0A1G8T648_9BACI|nr:sodium/glutamate symporter [Salimicrobium halophilum]SDJ36968.1 glutamate:Na+ symporter, ESS family [Salimicrobium halophilum]
MTANVIGFALLVMGVFLLVGKMIRVSVPLFQSLFLPSSILGGFAALLLGPQVLGNLLEPLTGEDSFWSTGLFTEGITEVWAALPGLMINVIFASLFIGKKTPSLKKILNYGGPQLAFGWTVGWGQYVIGLLIAVLILTPFFGIPPMAGALIEIGFEGGHGTAAGMQSTFQELGFPQAYDLAVGLATIGVLSGVIVGIILINIAARKKQTAIEMDENSFSDLQKLGIREFENREAAGKMTVRSESIEPLSFHVAMISIAILIGYGIQQAFIGLEAITWGPWTDTYVMTYIPLFPLAMIGGILLQLFLDRFDRFNLVDRQMVMRVQGLSLDVLILTAIATISLAVIGEYFVPFLLLAIAGIGWNVLAFKLFAKKMIPSYWFERAIGDFGQSMGITATGLLLMRIVDPNVETPALEAFGYKQLIYEPFLGGGLVTALSVPLIYSLGPIPFLIFAFLMSLIGWAAGIFYFGKQNTESF